MDFFAKLPTKYPTLKVATSSSSFVASRPMVRLERQARPRLEAAEWANCAPSWYPRIRCDDMEHEMQAHSARKEVTIRRSLLCCGILALGLPLGSCGYVRLLRPSVLKQLNPRVVRLVN